MNQCPNCGERLIAHKDGVTPCGRHYTLHICLMCKYHEAEVKE